MRKFELGIFAVIFIAYTLWLATSILDLFKLGYLLIIWLVCILSFSVWAYREESKREKEKR